MRAFSGTFQQLLCPALHGRADDSLPLSPVAGVFLRQGPAPDELYCGCISSRSTPERSATRQQEKRMLAGLLLCWSSALGVFSAHSLSPQRLRRGQVPRRSFLL